MSVAASLRDTTAMVNYRRKGAPTKTLKSNTLDKWFDNVVESGTRAVDFDLYYERKQVSVVDGRTHLPEGPAAWKFDEHGFCFVSAPEPVENFQDRKLVEQVYAPRVLEAMQKATNAKRVFWLSHYRRAEKGDKNQGARANSSEIYATGLIHSDYGPGFEEQFRTVLERRYGLSREEAQTCGMVVANMWIPIQRNAYKDPLALLDGSSVDLAEESIQWKLPTDDPAETYLAAQKKKSAGPEGAPKVNVRPVEERVPQAAADAPAIAPTYSAKHRFVYFPDMTTEEALVFKQYDFRKSQPAKATFHMSFKDGFHDDWKDCPGRRSLECRMVLVFDPHEAAPHHAKL